MRRHFSLLPVDQEKPQQLNSFSRAQQSNVMRGLLFFAALLLLSAGESCNTKKENTIGHVERIDPALDAVVDKESAVEIIADGFEWTEGPLWLEKEKALLFSDIPVNSIYKWTAASGKTLYLSPSGYTGTIKRGGEPGSNGLALDATGRLVLCQHGDRRIAVMNAPVDTPAAASPAWQIITRVKS